MSAYMPECLYARGRIQCNISESDDVMLAVVG
jgi:hypothetical protein